MYSFSLCNQPFHPWEWGSYLVCLWCCVTMVVGFPFDIPLVAEELPDIVRDKPGCYMDRQHYSYGEMWNPVLIPHGAMVCIRCQCLQVEKKGLMLTQGRTMCRNIKDLCPIPTCPNPTLRPGKCCKSCPGDDFEDKFSFHPNVFANNVYSRDEASLDPEAKDFQALLVGHHVPTGPVFTRAIALVRLTIEGPNSVHYALRYSHIDRPKYLRIVHINGNVLFKTPVVKQMNGDKKACGEWKNPSPMHLDYIREGKVVVVISTSRNTDGIVAGRIKVAQDIDDEVFSSLLTDKTSQGGGALASMSYSPKSRTISYNVLTDDVAVKGRRGIFVVSIMKGSKVIYKTKGTAMAKTAKLSGRWRVYKRSHRRQLGRGLLRMRVKFSDGHVLIGNIQTKLNCNIFQAVLSGGQAPGRRKTVSAGSVVVRMGDNAKIHYSVRLSNMVTKVTKIKLEGHRRRKRAKMRNYGNLHHSFVRDHNNTFNGWANGTLKTLDADAIHGLLTNQLYVSVSVSGRRGKELKGRLVLHDPNRQHVHQETPATLVPTTHEARGGAGMVWLSIDSRCRLHFDAMCTNPVGGTSQSFEVYLVNDGDFSGGDKKWLPVKRFPEKRFGYIYTRGEVANLSGDVLRDLDTGRMFLQMSASKNRREVYRANITVPNTCWLTPNDADKLPSEDNRLPGAVIQHKMCRFEGQMYAEGTAWIPDVDQACTTCSCVRGKTLCQRMTCPVLSCPNPVKVEGRCCPSCPHEDPTEMCQLGEDPRHYPLHSVWHPYLPTDGFSPCALCTCLPGKRVKCHRQPCPIPPCQRSDWVKDENNSCCYKCRVNSTVPVERDDVITQPQSDVSMEGACIVNEILRHNGERWHPSIHPFGYMKCFYCVCENGTFTCAREQCPVLTCAKKIKRPNHCCEECAADQGSDVTTVVARPHQAPIKASLPGCRVSDKVYKEGERWSPSHGQDADDTSMCMVCKCKSGQVTCRPKCPKVCKDDPFKHTCCKHCTDRNSRNKQKDLKTTKKRKKSKSSILKRKHRRDRDARRKTSKGKHNTPYDGSDADFDLMSLLKHE